MHSDGVTCKKCVSPCAECFREADFCLVCGYGEERRITAPTCRCKDERNIDGKMLGDAGTSCVYCLDPCLDCKGLTSTDCLSCIDGYVHDGETNTCS